MCERFHIVAGCVEMARAQSWPQHWLEVQRAWMGRLQQQQAHITLAHCATCRGDPHLRVGQPNSRNRYDTKSYHTSRCTHGKLSKNDQKQCTTGVLGRCQNTHKKYFQWPKLLIDRKTRPPGLAQTTLKPGIEFILWLSRADTRWGCANTMSYKLPLPRKNRILVAYSPEKATRILFFLGTDVF